MRSDNAFVSDLDSGLNYDARPDTDIAAELGRGIDHRAGMDAGLGRRGPMEPGDNPKWVLHTSNPSRYWVLVRTGVRDPGMPQPMPALQTLIRPPIISQSRLVIANPSPVPP